MRYDETPNETTTELTPTTIEYAMLPCPIVGDASAATLKALEDSRTMIHAMAYDTKLNQFMILVSRPKTEAPAEG